MSTQFQGGFQTETFKPQTNVIQITMLNKIETLNGKYSRIFDTQMHSSGAQCKKKNQVDIWMR